MLAGAGRELLQSQVSRGGPLGLAPGRAQPGSFQPGPNSSGKWLLSAGYYFEVWKDSEEVFSL